MSGRSPLRCPDDGWEMNLHAAKLSEPSSPEEARAADPELGGIVEEVFTCPECGRSASRPR